MFRFFFFFFLKWKATVGSSRRCGWVRSKCLTKACPQKLSFLLAFKINQALAWLQDLSIALVCGSHYQHCFRHMVGNARIHLLQWTSPEAQVRTGSNQRVNFQCIKDCLVQQASLTYRMGVLGVRNQIDARTKETVSNREGPKEMGCQGISFECG